MTLARLGLRKNWAQFSLLVLVNAFVGAMIGMERSILPQLAQDEFGLASKSAILLFIAFFGLSKAIANFFAGRASDRGGRKPVLLWGWAIAAPVPFLLMWAPSWEWILFANIFLGVSQGLTWSTTVIMKIDLAGPKDRGLALGLNECAGYLAVAASAWISGWIAVEYGLRPYPFLMGYLYVGVGTALSLFAVRETRAHAEHEISNFTARSAPRLKTREVFMRTTLQDRNLSSIVQAGLVNNLNDGVTWGLFPLLFAAHAMDLKQIGVLMAIYPASWGVLQLFTGPLSDRYGRKWLIVLGMGVQAIGIALTLLSSAWTGFAAGGLLLGLGTAMVYPTLIAALSDVAEPQWRATAVGVYRLWRDLGYTFGALIAGWIADRFGLEWALASVASLTFLSGVWCAVRLSETHQPSSSDQRA